jgi:hypothetical protein
MRLRIIHFYLAGKKHIDWRHRRQIIPCADAVAEVVVPLGTHENKYMLGFVFSQKKRLFFPAENDHSKIGHCLWKGCRLIEWFRDRGNIDPLQWSLTLVKSKSPPPHPHLCICTHRKFGTEEETWGNVQLTGLLTS